MNIKIENYLITSDSMQFIVNKIGTVQESRLTNAENVGKETSKVIGYMEKFEQVLNFIPNDVLKTNDDINIIMDKLNAIQGDIQAIKEYPVIFIKEEPKELNNLQKLKLINTMEFIEDDSDGENCNSVTIEDNEINRTIINNIGFDNDYIDNEMMDVAYGYLNIAVIAFKYCNWWNGDYFLNQNIEESEKEEVTDNE